MLRTSRALEAAARPSGAAGAVARSPAAHMLRRYSSVAATQSSAQPEAQQAQPQEQAPRPQVVSSCKEGTVLKGLNVLKDGKDPVAKADSGYPAWLWTLLDPKEPPVEKKDQLSIHHLRSLSREKIRAFALSKQTKY